MKNILLVIIFGMLYFNVSANNVSITNLNKTNSTITFDLSWENSWRNGLTYHDAVWVFFKQASNGGPSWQHVKVLLASADAGYETVVPSDKVGFFVRRSINGNGTSSTSVSATLLGLSGAFQDIKAMGVEMVYVPTGDFFAGDGYSYGRIASGDNELESVHILSNNSLTCGSTSNDIQYVTNSGDCENVPSTFPIGYNEFYCMKYAITQRQYVDFLNCLNRNQQENRIASEVTGTFVTNMFVLCDSTISIKGNVVRCDFSIGTGNITFYCDRNNNGVPNELDDGMARACNYLTTKDWAAYLDWSGLRPFSFLEVEKASRGTLNAVQGESSWGSTLINSPLALQNAGMENEKWVNSTFAGGIITHYDGVIRVGCNAPSTGATRELSNASFYGIIDIGNNPGDFYIPQILSFEAIEGDGTLNSAGASNVNTWPFSSGDSSINIKVTNFYYGISDIFYPAPERSEINGGRGVRSNF